MHNTNKQKLLVVSHVILDYTCNSVYLFQIPGGMYIIDFFSDEAITINLLEDEDESCMFYFLWIYLMVLAAPCR